MTKRQPHPPWFTPRLPTPEECSLGHLLAVQAASDPQRPLLVRDDGSACSAGAMHDRALAMAGRLAGLGTKSGDNVLVWLPNGEELVRVIFALSMLGATIVPLNTALRGTSLTHLIESAGAEVMVCHPELLERIGPIDGGKLRTIMLLGEDSGAHDQFAVTCEAALRVEPITINLNQPWDIAAIIFSSGTTGPSKGVRIPGAQLWTLARVFYGYMQPSDRMLLMYPLFHIAGFSAVYGAMTAGATLAITEGFRASGFWTVLRTTGATTLPGLGPTFIDIIAKAEPQTDDADNSLRHVNVQSLTPAARAFAARFRCDIMGAYSMTETSGICVSGVNEASEAIVGRPRDGIQVRIVDAHDVELPIGEPGEVLVRADLPWSLNAGYHANAEATAQAWRNGWFHTGDVARRDAAGNIAFVDRKKDVIRRRSENISSSEIEAEVRAHPAVQDVAAIGVTTAGGEEVLIAVTAIAGRTVEPLALIEFLIPRMPHFMVPRFVRVMAELPKTHTNRVQKDALREAGVTPDSWDREAAGIVLRGLRLGAIRGS